MDRLARLCVFFFGTLLLLLSPAAAAEVQSKTQFGGVGVQVVPTITGHLVVLNVVPEGPAFDAGLLPGDLVFQVNDFPLKGSTFAEVVAAHLWGPVDSAVTLHYLRPGIAGSRTVTLRRANLAPRMTVSPAVQGQGGD